MLARRGLAMMVLLKAGFGFVVTVCLGNRSMMILAKRLSKIGDCIFLGFKLGYRHPQLSPN